MNNSIMRDRSRIKQRIRSTLDFNSEAAARIIPSGIEINHNIRKQSNVFTDQIRDLSNKIAKRLLRK
jgi:transposase-like protein